MKIVKTDQNYDNGILQIALVISLDKIKRSLGILPLTLSNMQN
jgi:hypothetical protein